MFIKDFKNFNLKEFEEKILEFWEKNKIFEKSLEKTKKGKPFTFYDGPPFATGLPHYGHILASTIKDVVPRYQTMRGRFVRRRWGWDCHGLPIEEIVERKLGISGKKEIEKIGIKKFNETCRSVVLEYAHEWGKMVRRIARWVEFENSYKTMDPDYMESVWWAFKKIYDKGLVYEGRKVLLYCPRCETPISNFEVAMDNSYKLVEEEAITVKFKVRDSGVLNLEPETYLLAWTTTPWTLPGNVALAVGADISYALLEESETNQFYILARDLVQKVFGKKEVKIIKDIKGKDLTGLEYEPLFDVLPLKSKESYKVYADRFVTVEEGTGIVHIAPAYGEDDYTLGVRENLPVVPLLDEKGRFNEKAPKFVRGVYFKESEKDVKSDLEKRGLLFKREMHQHSYPYCWRCSSELFYNAIPAWFINIKKIKAKLLKSNAKEINWFPAHLKHGRYQKSVEAAPDWNISRNRYWGNPIPVWRCDRCKKEEVIGSLEELHKKSGGARNSYWVMRHGEAKTNLAYKIDSGLMGGNTLTTLGREAVYISAKKFLRKLKKKNGKIDLIISSDVIRAKETAKIAADILGVKKLIFDKRLREINLGPELEGCHSAKYYKLYPSYESRFENRPKGGESLRDLRSRVWRFLEDCEKRYRGKNILFVSHEYPIWMMEHTALGWSEARAIDEKKRREGDYIKTAEIRELDFKVIPRNDTGEVDLHRPYIDDVVFSCLRCRGEMKRITEIFDSWTEAGSMPFAEYHYPFENKKVFESRFPAQFVAEYIAQTRAWFYVMHVISLVLFGKAPFENVVTTGTILAEDGSKMSKSKGNFPDPWKVIEKYGADSLRFYLMNSVVMQADNLNFSEKEVEKAYKKVVLMLLNVYNYFRTYAPEKRRRERGDSSLTASYEALDKWIGVKIEELKKQVTECLDFYDTVRATRAIVGYVDDLSTWYLRRSRKRKDESFFTTLGLSLLEVSKVIAPFMPFLSEFLYQELCGRVQAKGAERRKIPRDSAVKSVHLEKWPTYSKLQIEKGKSLLNAMAEVRRVASLALAKRAEAGIKVRQPLSALRIKNLELGIRNKKELLEILKDEVNVKNILFDSKIRDEVELDTNITPELKEEGIVREFIRMVQGLRQEAGYVPKDKIALFVEVKDDVLEGILSRNVSAVKKEVGARSIEFKRDKKFDAEFSGRFELADIWLGVRKL